MGPLGVTGDVATGVTFLSLLPSDFHWDRRRVRFVSQRRVCEHRDPAVKSKEGVSPC